MKLDYVDLCDVCDSGSATNFSFTHMHVAASFMWTLVSISLTI